MKPSIQQWICMREPENKPMWLRADGSTRRTSPYTVELLLGDDQQDQDFIYPDEENTHRFEDP
eukprot:11622616-Prorocentrum_lima.AAC.1